MNNCALEIMVDKSSLANLHKKFFIFIENYLFFIFSIQHKECEWKESIFTNPTLDIISHPSELLGQG
jgi:hypothetical protein